MRAVVILALPILACAFSPASVITRPVPAPGFTSISSRRLPLVCPRVAKVAQTVRCVAVEGGGDKAVTDWSKDPDAELLADALEKAATVVREAGGCIDSLSFGREWRDKYPDFQRDSFKGTPVSSFNKLLTLYGQELFVIEATKKKEIKLYILRDAQGVEGRRQYQARADRQKELAASPLASFFQPFFEIRGGKMRAGGAGALPPNLANIKSLSQLLDALEPNLISLAGGVNSLSGKDAATALNHCKRLAHEARYQVTKNRLESSIRGFANAALLNMDTMPSKFVALVVNALADRPGYDAVLIAASARVQELADEPAVEGEEALFTPQTVAVIVNALSKTKLGGVPAEKASKVDGTDKKALLAALSRVALALPDDEFDAQAVVNIANGMARVDARPDDEALYAKLCRVAMARPKDEWSATGLAILSSALVRVKYPAGSLELLQRLSEQAVDKLQEEGPDAFPSPVSSASLLEAMDAACVYHAPLFSGLGVLAAMQLGNGKKPLPRGRTARRYRQALDARTLALLGRSLRRGGIQDKGMWKTLRGECRRQTLQGADALTLANAIEAFAPHSSDTVEERARDSRVSKTGTVASGGAFSEAGSLTAAIAAGEELWDEWDEGSGDSLEDKWADDGGDTFITSAGVFGGPVVDVPASAAADPDGMGPFLAAALLDFPMAALGVPNNMAALLEAMAASDWRDGPTVTRLVMAAVKTEPPFWDARALSRCLVAAAKLEMPRNLAPMRVALTRTACTLVSLPPPLEERPVDADDLLAAAAQGDVRSIVEAVQAAREERGGTLSVQEGSGILALQEGPQARGVAGGGFSLSDMANMVEATLALSTPGQDSTDAANLLGACARALARLAAPPGAEDVLALRRLASLAADAGREDDAAAWRTAADAVAT